MKLSDVVDLYAEIIPKVWEAKKNRMKQAIKEAVNELKEEKII